MTPCGTPGSIIKLFNHVASFIPSVAAMHSASVVDNTTIGYRDAFPRIYSDDVAISRTPMIKISNTIRVNESYNIIGCNVGLIKQ